MKLFLTLVLALVLLTRSSSAAGRSKDLESLEKCEPINIEMCKSLPYDKTLFPNHLGQKNQEEADRTIVTYSPLINIKCSADIQLFLCSMLAPVCTVLPKPLLPCRSLCESAREGCESLMKSFGYSWPDAFDCSKLPIDGGAELCMGRNSSGVDDRKLESFKTSTISPGIPNKYDEGFVICPAQLKAPKDKDYSLAVGDVQVEDCGAPCYNMFFGQGKITQINTWSGVWAIFGMIPCLFTIATYLIDPTRFPFPQLSIIFMSFCYLIVTIVYIIGFALGDNVACGQAFEVKDINLETERLVRQGTLDDWRCQVIAMVLYFFDTAGSLWWVMLTVGWFLEAGLKWGSEAIEGSYLHAIVWTVAAIQMVLMVVLKKIEGDILSGVCFVGLWDSHSLLSFVVIPKALYLSIGFVFLIMGVVSHIRVRSEIQKRREKTDALESLLCRIGKTLTSERKSLTILSWFVFPTFRPFFLFVSLTRQHRIWLLCL